MALSKLSKDDYITHSFGQKSEAVQGGTYGLVVGGINQTSPTAIGDGEYSPLNVDTSGNLMVNIAAGEVISATINVGTINAATVDLMKAGTITALANGTIGAGTLNTMGTLSNVLAGSITVVAGTVSAGTINTGTITAGSIVVTAGTIAAGSLAITAATISAGTINTGTVNAGTIDVMKVGTITAGTINTGTVNAGTIDVLKVGTITAGSIAVIAGTVNAGTINAGTITAGTINVGTITAGTINTGTVNAGTIDLMKAGTVTRVEGGSMAITAGTVRVTNYGMSSSYATITVSTPASAGTLAASFNAELRGVTIVTPDLEGTGTATIRLIDGKSGTVASFAAQVESATVYYGSIVPVTTNMNWVATCDGTQSSNRSIELGLHYMQ